MIKDPFFYNYLILGILLLFSFYFSGSETAIFSLNRLERNALKETKSPKKNYIISYLLDNQEQLLITILTGNMLVNIFASSMGSIIGDRLFEGQSEIFSIIGMTLLLLLIGELTPKRIAINHSKSFTLLTATPLFYLHHILGSARYVLNYVSTRILILIPGNKIHEKEDKHALVLSTAELGFNQEILHYSEYNLFKSYLSFKNKSAYGIMTPRSELKSLSDDLKLSQVIEIISTNREYVMNSTLLLHKNDQDNLMGWVPVAELLEKKFKNINLDESITTISRDFYTVPKSKKLPVLISEMREKNISIALLLDEYGGTSGIIWFRNVIENVLRTFYNPYKEKFNEKIHNHKIIPGSMAIEDLEDFLDIEIDLDVETVAGFFLEQFGGLPVPGDEIQFHELFFRVMEMDGNRIKKLMIEMRAGI